MAHPLKDYMLPSEIDLLNQPVEEWLEDYNNGENNDKL